MTAELDPTRDQPAKTRGARGIGDHGFDDAAHVRRVLRALAADQRRAPTTLDATANDNIYSHERRDDETFLSIVLVVGETPARLLDDALVALDAQSDEDFELIVVVSSRDPTELATVDERLRPFNSGLARRTRLVQATPASSEPTWRGEAVRAGCALARGRYVSVLDASSVVFGHYVRSLSRLSRTSAAGVLRARALIQPLHASSWPSGESGFEPAGGAAPASVEHFSVLEHLVQPATPVGSYALRRDFVSDLPADVDEDEVLAEAALLAGVHEDVDDVIVLLRHLTP